MNDYISVVLYIIIVFYDNNSLIHCAFFRIDEFGVPYLQFFLKQCNTLTSLDISNNNLGDFQCGDVFQCLARPPLDFDERDGNN